MQYMVRTRIAPSPTGEDLHIGNLYTAYLNWVFAKKNSGKFIVRIEDTDRTRLVEGSEQKILQTLSSFGLDPDEPIIHQSERLEIYKKHAEDLVKKEAAYYCTCTKERLDELRRKQTAAKQVPKYDKHCLNKAPSTKYQAPSTEQYVIRLNVPKDRQVTFHDEIRGDITFNTRDIDDQVLIKSDGYPTYHLAVVVDDYLMKITHVIRAEEWISSTPKHILLYESFGWELPIFAHVPILRNPDKSKLSKRKNPVWASWYLEQGYLPEAILNFLSLMVWSHPEGKEMFSKEEFIKEFTLERVRTVGPVFDTQKLEWMNGEYIRKTQSSKLKMQIFQFYKGDYSKDLVAKMIPLIQERIKTLKAYDDYCRFFIKLPKNYETDLSNYREILKKTIEELEKLGDWKADKIGNAMQNIAKEMNTKNSEYFMTIRVAISGKKITPPLNESMEILGKEECLKRITLAI